MQSTSLTRTKIRMKSWTVLSLGLALSLSSGCNKKGGDATTNPEAAADAAANQAAEQKKAKATGLVEVANGDLAKGRYHSARKRAEEALQANPKNADAHAILAASYWREGEYQQSTDAYRAGLDSDPKHFGATIGLSRNLQAQGDHTGAIEVLDKLIATESEGFTETKCSEEDGECDVGWCEQKTKTCKAPMQVRPRINKLLSQYLMLDVEGATKTVDEIFLGIGGDENLLGVANSLASFLRPLEAKGPFVEIAGTAGSARLGIDAALGVKFASLTVAGKSTATIFNEIQDETRISPALAEKLSLAPIGQFKAFFAEEEQGIVVIPEIAIGELVIKNVPAIIQDLSDYEGIGESVGLSLGRQVIHKLGTVSFNFAAQTLDVAVEAPQNPPPGSVELPLLMMDMYVSRAPVVQVNVDGGNHSFWAWFGGVYPCGVTVTAKEYLRAQHRPDDLAEPEDAERGLKMVFVDSVDLGSINVPGVGGIVLTSNPPDLGLANVVQMASFELGGYVNMTLYKDWKVTYALSKGRIYIDPLQAPAEPPPA